MNLLWKYNSLNILSFGKKRISGRNNTGKIMRYHRGGGCKNKIRIIDFKRYIWNLYGFVLRLEYDPNRTALLALIAYSNGIISYIIAPEGLSVGDRVLAKDEILYKPGNCTYLFKIPIGVKIHNVELSVNKGGQLARAAGSFSIIISHLQKYSVIKLKSGELRKVLGTCLATIGSVSNFEFGFRKFMKAGYYRLKGWRPVVRGVAMNPVDHPHGGGQGKTSGGRPSVTPKGIITKGKPTRKHSSSMILKRR